MLIFYGSGDAFWCENWAEKPIGGSSIFKQIGVAAPTNRHWMGTLCVGGFVERNQ
jgi:hypothetical protein